ncbi:MAG: hypothetical protein M1813_003314, partial [Trichoglossum hirsutum]
IKTKSQTSKESYLLLSDLKATLASIKLLKYKEPLSSTYVEEVNDDDEVTIVAAVTIAAAAIQEIADSEEEQVEEDQA